MLAGGALADDLHRHRATAMGGYTATAVLTAAIGAATRPGGSASSGRAAGSPAAYEVPRLGAFALLP